MLANKPANNRFKNRIFTSASDGNEFSIPSASISIAALAPGERSRDTVIAGFHFTTGLTTTIMNVSGLAAALALPVEGLNSAVGR
jgi:hypothetical protein